MSWYHAILVGHTMLIIVLSTTADVNKDIQTIEKYENEENSQNTWNDRAQETLEEQLRSSMTKLADHAKSGVLVVGGGMSIQTLRSARAMKGLKVKKEVSLEFEKFPVLGMVKTYCSDSQIGDAACTAGAYLSGVRSPSGVSGAPQSADENNCAIPDDLNKNILGSIAEWALAAGKSVGIVTTSSVTHPSIAESYSRISKLSMQSDVHLVEDNFDPPACSDLAQQLMQNYPGNKFKVIFGGGRENFLPSSIDGGKRLDGKNLIERWIQDRTNKKTKYQYITHRDDLMKMNDDSEYVLGLFGIGNLDYHITANAAQPTLTEMTEAAIKVLSKNGKGFFLFIFGGRINDAHNENKAIIAIDETLELSKAVAKVSELTDEEDTLTIVTADHAHSMTVSGYNPRWHDFYDVVRDNSDQVDDIPYVTIVYANGPGFRKENFLLEKRYDYSKDQMYQKRDPHFQFPAVFPLDVASPGGEDVALFAKGPGQHLFNGVLDQYILPHLMAYSLCIGYGLTACDNNNSRISHVEVTNPSKSTASTTSPLNVILLMVIFYNMRIYYL